MVEGVEVKSPHARERLRWRATLEQRVGLLLEAVAGLVAPVLRILAAPSLAAAYATDKRVASTVVRLLMHRLFRVLLLPVVVAVAVGQFVELTLPWSLVTTAL